MLFLMLMLPFQINQLPLKVTIHKDRMESLNLPPFEMKISEQGGKKYIWDPIRKKPVPFTPEEHVRQAFVSYLVGYKGVPLSHIANEQAIELNGMSRRCDSVIYDRTGAPKVIVEYKAPSVNLTAKVFEQVARYNLVLKVEYLIVSNGLRHYCLRTDYVNHSFSFLSDIPSYDMI